MTDREFLVYASLTVCALLVAGFAYAMVDPRVLVRRRIRQRADSRKGWLR